MVTCLNFSLKKSSRLQQPSSRWDVLRYFFLLQHHKTRGEIKRMRKKRETRHSNRFSRFSSFSLTTDGFWRVFFISTLMHPRICFRKQEAFNEKLLGEWIWSGLVLDLLSFFLGGNDFLWRKCGGICGRDLIAMMNVELKYRSHKSDAVDLNIFRSTELIEWNNWRSFLSGSLITFVATVK